MQWAGKDGTPYNENILAWVTPEAPEIDTLLRDSADSANALWGLNSIVGYQDPGNGWTESQITYAQVSAMMYTLANTYNVKYISASFSSTGSDLQSIKTPAQVIDNAAGLCVETTVTMASAIQRTGMHAVILILPTHAQVAVETWAGSGEYFLIETTALDAAHDALATPANWDYVIAYKTKDEWTQYLTQNNVVAIDCALAESLHIQSID
jgi:hypothetical protein